MPLATPWLFIPGARSQIVKKHKCCRPAALGFIDWYELFGNNSEQTLPNPNIYVATH